MISLPAVNGATASGRLMRVVRWAVIAGSATLVAGNLWIVLRAHGRIFTQVQDVPPTEVGLVLGTSNRTPDGGANQFFTGRMAAAAELYRAGKVRRLLLSGANHSANYNEPVNMRRALVARGVPEAALTLDETGFRTFDSAARAQSIFGLSRVTIVTDDFHAPRAVLLARHFGVDAQAYCSAPVPWPLSKKTRIREIGARIKALLDLYLLQTEPDLSPLTE